jgi:hypothetical protein
MELTRAYSQPHQRAAFAVDRTEKVIKGVALCSTGEARGHGVWADAEFVQKVVQLANQQPDGLKVRFGHPGWFVDGIGSEVGVVKNVTYVEAKKESAERGYTVAYAIGDFYAFEPSQKNEAAIDHIFSLAEQAHTLFGMSIVFWSDGFKEDEDGLEVIDNPKGYPHDTISILSACDFVSDPALNPSGLFPKELSAIRKLTDLVSGLKDNSLEPIKRFFSSLVSPQEPASHLDMSKTTTTPAGLSDYRGKRRLLERKGLTAFGEGTDADGQTIRWPSDVPVLGDGIVIVDAEGVESAAPAGEYVIAGEGVTWTLTTDAEGLLIEVSQKAEAMAAVTTDLSASLAAAQKRAADADTQLAKAEAELEKAKAESQAAQKRAADAEKLRTVKDTKPEFVNDKPEMDKRQVFQVGGATLESETRETVRKVLANKRATASAMKRGDFQEVERLSAMAPKFRATGEGWDIQSPGPPDLLLRAPYIEEIIREELLTELASDYLTVKNYDVRGASTVSVTLPVLSDVSGGTYLKPGFPCDPEFEGNSKLVARSMTLVPFHYARQYCVRDEEWGNLFNGKYFVGNQEIPLQTVFIEQMVAGILEEINLTIFHGRIGPHIMDGLVTQAIADGLVPKEAYTVEYSAPTALLNPYTYTQRLDAAITPAMRRRSSREELQWMLAEPQLRGYIAWVQQNNQFQVPLNSSVNVQPPVTTNAKWYPSWLMVDTLNAHAAGQDMYQLITFKKNLILGLSSLEGMGEKLLHFEPFKGQLQFLFNAHIGTTYAQSEMVVLGTPTPA